MQRLLDAGVEGVLPDGTITEQALMNPRFVDAIRPTVQRFREAPKATIEFGTLLTTVGKRAADLFEAAANSGDTVTQKNYMKALTSALFESSRKEFKKSGWQLLVRALTGEARNITRIETATGVDPFAVSGTFEGSLSPNIRIPLYDMTDAQISVFHAVVGKAMSQAAMASSQVLAVDGSSAPKEGYVHTSSIYVESVANLTEEQLLALYRALPEGHEVSIHTTPAGTVIDVNPRFTDEGPIGLQAADAESAIDALVALGFNEDKIHISDADYRSVYTEASEYDDLIRNFEQEMRHEAAEKLVGLGVERGAAASLVDGAAPLEGGGTDALPASIRGKARTIQKALGRRLSDFADAATSFNALAQKLEQRWEADFSKAENRIRKAGGSVPPVDAAQPLGRVRRSGPSRGLACYQRSKQMPTKKPSEVMELFSKLASSTLPIQSDERVTPQPQPWTKEEMEYDESEDIRAEALRRLKVRQMSQGRLAPTPASSPSLSSTPPTTE